MNIQKSINKIVRERESRKTKYERVRKILVILTTLFLGIFIGSFFMQDNFSITGYVASGVLPTVGGDSGNWGTILNNYLSQEHTEEGGHANITSNNWTNVSITSSQVTNFNNTVWELAGNGTLMLTSNWNSTNSSYRTLGNQTFEGNVNVTGNLNVTGIITANQFNDSSTGNQAGTMQLIQTQTASNDVSINFTGLDDTYNEYILKISNYIGSSDDFLPKIQVSIDGGSTWKETSYSTFRRSSATSTSTIQFNNNDGNGIGIHLSATGGSGYDPGNGAGESFHSEVHFGSLTNTGEKKIFDYVSRYLGTTGKGVRTTGMGFWNGGNDAINAIRILNNAGNIASGEFSLYGIKK